MAPDSSILNAVLTLVLTALSVAAGLLSLEMMVSLSETRSIPLYYTPGFFPLVVSLLLLGMLSFRILPALKIISMNVKSFNGAALGSQMRTAVPTIALLGLMTIYIATIGTVPFIYSTPPFIILSICFFSSRFDFKFIAYVGLSSILFAYCILYILRHIIFVPIV